MIQTGNKLWNRIIYGKFLQMGFRKKRVRARTHTYTALCHLNILIIKYEKCSARFE